MTGFDTTGDCRTCRHWRGFMNPNPGVKIPRPVPIPGKPKFAGGKCIREGGHCHPRIVRN